MKTSRAYLALLVVLVCLIPMTRFAQSPNSDAPNWAEIDRLISEDKYEAASSLVTQYREAAQSKGDEPEWTRALIKEVLLRTGLHGYETSVRFLREQPWPTAPRSRLALELFYAQSLVTYTQAYSWEIRQRERVVSTDEVDLKAWTLEQVTEEAHKAYASAWNQRQAWGEGSIGDLAEFFQVGDYPAHIRGTLRDTVTYLWVELLADTSLWRPEQSNEIFRLELDDLLSGVAVQLDDPSVHPLLKITSILGDLETWHQDSGGRGGRPEAAFEARLESLRRLWSSLSQEQDRKALKQHLRQKLDDLGRQYPWWSTGMAQLADYVRQSEAMGSLVEARAIALEGMKAHPDSYGGRRCQHLISVLEQPGYQLTTMKSDGLGQRSIQVRHRNLAELHFRAYALDLMRTVVAADDRSLLPSYQTVPKILARQRPVAEWKVDLPETPDLDWHLTYITPPLDKPSLYLIVASTRADFAERFNHQSAVSLILSDLVLMRSPSDSRSIRVVSGATGEALVGVQVDLYQYDWRKGHSRVDRQMTSPLGEVDFRAENRQGFFILASRGNDVALMENFRHFERGPSREVNQGLTYTDRSIYRPGQKILWKVVAYNSKGEAGGPGTRFRVLPGTELDVMLQDANGQEVATLDVKTNDYGSASGEFEIPPGRLLGSWSLQARTRDGGVISHIRVQVEEYKRPTFEAKIDDPTSPLRLNKPANLQGSARYYFGLPVTSGGVAWRVTREPVWSWWWRRYRGHSIRPGGSTPQTVASGTAELNADGHFEIRFTPEVDERLADSRSRTGISYRYRLSAEVTDEGGETRSASRSFRLGFVAVEASIDDPPGFFRQDRLRQEQADLLLRRSDLDGKPRAGSGRWRLVELEQPEKTLLPSERPVTPSNEDRHQTPGDQLRPRWDAASYSAQAMLGDWPDGRQHSQGKLEHGENGEGHLTLPKKLKPGAYRLHYATDDPFGATAEIAHEFFVLGERPTPLAVPGLLQAEATSVSVGDMARLVVHSGLADQPMELTIQHGNDVRKRQLISKKGVQLIEIPIQPADRGGFGVTLTLVRDHQLINLSERFFVPWDDRQLKVEFATFRDKLRPGQSETWTIRVLPGDGDKTDALNKGAAELLAYMYDKSLDLFAPHTPPDPQSLYPQRARVPGITTSLGQWGQVWNLSNGFAEISPNPQFRPDRLTVLDGYGIGGPGRRGNQRFKSRRAMPSAPMQSLAMQAAPPMAEAEGYAIDGVQVQNMRVVGSSPSLDETPPDSNDPAAAPPDDDPLRSDFSETAFWEPHLITGDDGAVTFEFSVPDSVTEWNVWVHALTRDLKFGRLNRQVRTVKELLVRPYLPRFLRENDSAEIRVVVNNAGEETLTGKLDFEIRDAETDENLLEEFGLAKSDAAGLAFTIEAGGGTELSFPLEVPPKVRGLAFKVRARAGDWSDGELRPLPVLPSRVHLAQSRFVTLRNKDRRVMRFDDLADVDSTRINDQLVVTLDAQLFYSVLQALPYLANYPYECTEQTLNRFLSTGIVSSLYESYPAVGRMARKFSERETQYETWDANDPNRKMALEETPWLVTSRGGGASASNLINVLDPKISASQRDASLAKLRESQTSSGGFPWWPGGPPSPYMTLYLLDNFSRALEFDVEVPQDIVTQAWAYMHRHYIGDLARKMVKNDCCWETITYLNYVLSNYPDASWTDGVFTDDDRRTMLEFSKQHWRQHSPRLKSYLALTLHREGQEEEARNIFASVMDSAKTTDDLGTFWAPEERSWLWYNDTIESHAFALRAILELEKNDARRHGLVQWLFLNKHLGHWKSTRATAEVIYSLVHYLEGEGTLGAREDATVKLGSDIHTFVFEPEEYTGKDNRIVVPGEKVDTNLAEIEVSKESPGFLFASATWHFSTEKLPEEARGDFFGVTRTFFKRVHDGREWSLQPLAEGSPIAVGDQLEVQLSLRTKHAAEYVHLRDPRGAGFEPETLKSGYRWDLGIGTYEEVRDSGTNFFFEWLPVGEYTFKYRLRASVAGTFRVGPATIQSMYAPEFTAYSSGAILDIGQ